MLTVIKMIDGTELVSMEIELFLYIENILPQR